MGQNPGRGKTATGGTSLKRSAVGQAEPPEASGAEAGAWAVEAGAWASDEGGKAAGGGGGAFWAAGDISTRGSGPSRIGAGASSSGAGTAAAGRGAAWGCGGGRRPPSACRLTWPRHIPASKLVPASQR